MPLQVEDFEYKPLQPGDIRLLKVVAFEPITIKFSHWSLSDTPDYYFLSYSWGAQVSQETVLCDGASLKVGHNLYQFLIRFKDLSVGDALFWPLLWIDALCINQRDNHEKEQLSSLLSSIPEHATRALCWVDVSLSPSYDRLVTRLRKLAACSGVQTSISRGTSSLNTPDRVTSTHLRAYRVAETVMFPENPPSADVNGWQDITVLLREGYFSRRWVYLDFINTRQPLLLTRNTTSSLLDLFHALRFATLHMSSPIPLPISLSVVVSVPVMRSLYHGEVQSPASWYICYLLLATASCHLEQTNRTDAVVSVAALRRHGNTALQRHLGQYYDYPRHMIQGEWAMRLMTVVMNPTNTMPSDVWDFSTPYEPYILGHPASNFCASPYKFPDSTRDELPDLVNSGLMPKYQDVPLNTYRGTFCDTIDRISTYLPPRRFSDHYNLQQGNNLVFLDWLEMVTGYDSISTCAPTQDPLLAQFAETIHARGCNHLWETDPCPSAEAIVRSLREFLAHFDNDIPVNDEVRIFYAACYPSHGRRFGVTTDGRFCLLPKATSRGDLVCIPHGNKVPIVLRALQSITHGYDRDHIDYFPYYINLGECYIHGLMHAEVAASQGSREAEFALV